MQSFAKIRMRMTLLYTLVLAGLSIASALILYAAISVSLESTNAQALKIYATQLASAKELALKSAEESTSYNAVVKSLEDNRISYRIWNDAFTVIGSSDENRLDDADSFKLIQKYFAGRSGGEQITDVSLKDVSLKVCTYAYVSSSGKLMMVQLVKDMASQRQVLEGPLLTIGAVLIGGIVLSVVLGNFLSARALRPVRQSYEQQRNFLADASHELRTPVAVVLANLEAVMAHPAGTVESQKKWIDNAYSETRRIKAVVEDLLFLAKADAGEKISKKVPVDLSYLLMEITERLTGLAEKKDIHLSAAIHDTELYVMGDEKRLSELMRILIDNAIKYTNPGGWVTVSADSAGQNVIVTVSDNGIGIPKSEQQKIFQRFYRVDKARSRAEGGTGLGLSIAQWIVQEHDAAIGVDSAEDKGTSFTLTFKRCSIYDDTAFDEEQEDYGDTERIK